MASDGWDKDGLAPDDRDAPDPLLRPVWDDTPDETDNPPDNPPDNPADDPAARVQAAPRASGRMAAGDATPLLAPLAAAQDALARLDARAGAASASLRSGLIARLALREAAGLLAARHAWVHPLDLALRTLDLAGRFDTAVQIDRAGAAMPNTGARPPEIWRDSGDLPALAAGERAVTLALHLARLLGALPRWHDPLADPAAAAITLGPLDARALDPARFVAWRDAWLANRPGRTAAGRAAHALLPPLLRAAHAAEAWMGAGIVEAPDPVQALAVAALCLVRTGALTVIPLPFWAAWPVLGQSEARQLPRLRGDASRRLTGADRASWAVSFLALAAEAARAGLRELDRLEAVAAAGARLTAGGDRRSRLADALATLIAVPALTPKALAARLHVSSQAATRLLTILAQAGVAAEVTGRKSFRAFAA